MPSYLPLANLELGHHARWELGRENEERYCSLSALLRHRMMIGLKHSGQQSTEQADGMDRVLRSGYDSIPLGKFRPKDHTYSQWHAFWEQGQEYARSAFNG